MNRKDKDNQIATGENDNVQPHEDNLSIDDVLSEDDQKWAVKQLSNLQNDYADRENGSIVSNGMSYSDAYEDNIRKAVNFALPRVENEDSQVSTGLIHEKIFALMAISLKFAWKRKMHAYSRKGTSLERVADYYSLAIEMSRRLEKFKEKLDLIFFQLNSQGDVFMLDEIEVQTTAKKIVKDKRTGEEVDDAHMDLSPEALENYLYEDGESEQYRLISSRILDNRQVILGNVTLNDLQQQPRIWIEVMLDRAEAEKQFGTLKMWKNVPKSASDITNVYSGQTIAYTRNGDMENKVVLHYLFDKMHNRYNIFANGIPLLPIMTPFTVAYPRNHYPITQICAERVFGNAYSVSVPSKTKFTMDFLDKMYRVLAEKFEQGARPAVFVQGESKLTRKMFNAGAVTHGVDGSKVSKADPDNKGVTQADMSFFDFLTKTIEIQTLSATAEGQLGNGASATEIATIDQNQKAKLATYLNSLVNGMAAMDITRAYTIERFYTDVRDQIEVDGKKTNVYYSFTLNVDDVTHNVTLDDRLDDPINNTKEVFEDWQNELHMIDHQNRMKGYETNHVVAGPKYIRNGGFMLFCEIFPEQEQPQELKVRSFTQEMIELRTLFPTRYNEDEAMRIYLNISGRPKALLMPSQNPLTKAQPMQPDAPQPVEKTKKQAIDVAKMG